MEIDKKPTEEAVRIAELEAEIDNLEKENEKLHTRYAEAENGRLMALSRADSLNSQLGSSYRKIERLFDMLEGAINIAQR